MKGDLYLGGYLRFKEKVFDAIEKNTRGSVIGKCFDLLIVTLILLNVAAIVFESFRQIEESYAAGLYEFELFSVIVFSAEYLLRLWTANIKYPELSAFRARIKFIISPMGLIDLFAILPFYLNLIVDLRFLRIIRLTRMFRLLKLNRYVKTLNMLSQIVKQKKDELIVTFFMTFLLIFISSTLIYYVENEAQPDKFPDIISSIWWAIATLTTIGYGDIYPITGAGKFLGGLIAILGIGFVALPTGIISSGFIEQIGKRPKPEAERSTYDICPHCGNKLSFERIKEEEHT